MVGDAATTPENTPVTIDVLGNDDPGSEGPLTITEINGQPIAVGSPVTLTDSDDRFAHWCRQSEQRWHAR